MILTVLHELEYWEKNVSPYADPVGGQQRWMWEEWATNW